VNFNINDRKISINKQNIIIFSLVLFFALHFLYFTEVYMINFPYAYDTTSLRIFINESEFLGENFTIMNYIENLFTDTNGRAIIFPKLLVLPNYLLNNFDSTNIFYLNFVILATTLLTIFLMLRENSKKLYWTLIPISALIFSPLIDANYWNYTILIWYLPALCIVASIYFLNKKHNFKNITIVLLLSIVSTYSIPLGLVIWASGTTVMLKKYIRKSIWKQKIPIFYFSSMIFIGIIYYTGNIGTQNIISFDEFFSIQTVYVFLTFLAVPFKLKYDILMMIAGIASVSIAGFLVYYLGLVRKQFKEIFPWMLFFIVSITAAILMRIGRFDPYFEGNLPYYSPISEYFQIGIIILVAILIYEIKRDNFLKNKKTMLFFLYSIIIIQMIFLIPSYYNGWWKGDYYYDQKTEYINCYSLHQDWSVTCEDSYNTSLDSKESYYSKFIIYNYLLKNNYNIFSNPDFNKNTIKELNDFNKKIDENTNMKKIEGHISRVNNFELSEKYFLNEDQSLIISGVISTDNIKEIEVMYLMIDGTPFAKFNDFYDSESTTGSNQLTNEIKWTFALLKSYLPEGCKQVSFMGMKNNEPFVLNDETEICNIPN